MIGKRRCGTKLIEEIFYFSAGQDMPEPQNGLMLNGGMP